jgi:hypothetical protein
MTSAPPLTLDDLLEAITATVSAMNEATCPICDGRLQRVAAATSMRLRCRDCGSAIEDAPVAVAA